jgi:hypothetical protein
MQLPRTAPTPNSDPLGHDAPFEEVTEAVLWQPGGWTASAVGFTLVAGWAGARLRLVHAHVFENGTRHVVDLLDRDDVDRDEHGAVRLPGVADNLWFVVPPKTRAVTIQYAARGGLSYLAEFKAA